MKQKITPRLIKTIDLATGLKLELYDASIKVAGDRWLVALTAIIDIFVNQTIIADQGPFNTIELKEALGGVVRFKRERKRDFVDEKDKDDVFRYLMDSFLTSSLAYLSHPDFPQKYVLREFKKYQTQKSWYPKTQKSTVA